MGTPYRQRVRIHLTGKHKIVGEVYNGRPYQVSRDELYRWMNLDPNRHLPDEGTPWIVIVDRLNYRRNVRVVSKAEAAITAKRLKKRFVHRVVAQCNGCLEVMPFSRLQQHICKGDK